MAASNNLTKQYVVDRIEARIGQIDKQVTEARALITKHQSDAIPKIAKEIGKIEEKVVNRIKLAKEAAKTDNYKDAAYQLSKLNSDLSGFRASDMPGMLPHTGMYSDKADPLVRAQNAIVQLPQEKLALEHSLVYLKELPLETVSLTTLRQLGLLEAVKFSLDVAISQARK